MRFKYFLTESKLFKTEQEIKMWFEGVVGVDSYDIKPNLMVNVKGSVNLNYHRMVNKLGRVPVKFGSVDGYFKVVSNDLDTLDGCPENVRDSFDCRDNKLTSLKGGPVYVGKDYLCGGNKLTSLEGAPDEVGGSVYLDHTGLTSLHDIHKHFKQIGDQIMLSWGDIKDSVLGLLMIKGLKYVEGLPAGMGGPPKKALDIINSYLPVKSKEAVFECQEELTEAKLENYAKL